MKSRDKRRRNRERREQAHNPVGVTVLPKSTEPVDGKWCRVRKTKISEAVCTVQSVRTPVFCKGCTALLQVAGGGSGHE